MSLIKELQRRNVFRVAMAYGVVAWLLIQVGATLEPAMHLPEWVDSVLAFFLLLGFPIAIFFAWAYELTPDGLKRDGEVDQDAGARALASQKWDRLIIFVLVLALGYFAVDKYLLKGSEPFSVQTAEQTSDPGGEKRDPTPTEETGKTSIPSKSIAVLPFVNMSSDPEQEYFSDGLTEELLNLLAGVKGLKVAARTSSFYYKDKLDEIKFSEVAEQLGVAHILEGSVRKSGNRIRITAQLIKADDGFHLWSETYDRELDDIFAIQDEISAKVVASLKVALLGEAPHATILNAESYELSLEGRFLFNRRDPGELERALELFERAVELDPNNVIAWIHMSPLYQWLFDPPRNEDSLAAASKAVELEPENPQALARLASIYGAMQNEEAWRSTWAKAVELGQNDGLVLSMRAGYAGYYGDVDQSIELQRRALSIDPLHLINIGNLASYLIQTGHWEEAIPWVEKLEHLNPNSVHIPIAKAEISLQSGDAESAAEYLQGNLRENTPSSGNSWLHDQVLAINIQFSLGNTDLATSMLNDFVKLYGEDQPHRVAWMYAWQKNNDRAFEWLDKSMTVLPDISAGFLTRYYLSGLHSDARWEHFDAFIKLQQEVSEY